MSVEGNLHQNNTIDKSAASLDERVIGVEEAEALANKTTFFRNTACEFFPCHDDVDPSEFNCLFCYCPLYTLGESCGGDFTYNHKGVKDCRTCSKLHRGDDGAALVKSHFKALAELAKRH